MENVSDKTDKHLSKDSVKLKFGIEALLSTDEKDKQSLGSVLGSNISKPLPAIGVPCSDCVTSLFRCCRLNTTAGGNSCSGVLHGIHQENLSASGFHSYGTPPHPMDMFTIQPIRPFATRPVRIPVQHTPSAHSSVNLSNSSNNAKRKRSWSRAVFSNLQRKGLERRFQLQKYITKPDRRQLAATLGLTDAQVKVWFQNRRMKWRHSKESSKNGDNGSVADSTQDQDLHIDVDTISEND